MPLEGGSAAARWLRWAREDLALGVHDFSSEDVVARGACVWSHQSAEKAIKALLAAHDIDPRRRHDLDQLCSSLPDDDARPLRLLALPELSRWAIEGRYPDDFDEATREQAQRALDLARDVLEVVTSRLELMGPR